MQAGGKWATALAALLASWTTMPAGDASARPPTPRFDTDRIVEPVARCRAGMRKNLTGQCVRARGNWLWWWRDA